MEETDPQSPTSDKDGLTLRSSTATTPFVRVAERLTASAASLCPSTAATSFAYIVEKKMKVRASVKRMCRFCMVLKRWGIVFIHNTSNANTSNARDSPPSLKPPSRARSDLR
jgi:ribosomal protein L36